MNCKRSWKFVEIAKSKPSVSIGYSWTVKSLDEVKAKLKDLKLALKIEDYDNI